MATVGDCYGQFGSPPHFCDVLRWSVGIVLVPIHWTVAGNDDRLVEWFLLWTCRAVLCLDVDMFRFRKVCM